MQENTIKIKLNKVRKADLYDGKKLNLVAIPVQSEFSSHGVYQPVPKADYDKGKQAEFIGDAEFETSEKVFIDIDITKVKKDALFVSEKTGNKYMDLKAIKTKSEYSDFGIVQDGLERDKQDFIGNARLESSLKMSTDQASEADQQEVDELPF